jgi:hypothetical protein
MVNTIYILHNTVKPLFHTSVGTMPIEYEIEDIVKPDNFKLCSVQKWVALLQNFGKPLKI